MTMEIIDDLSISLKKDITSTQIGYISPSWSSFPKKKYSIDVWKEGVIIKNIPLHLKEYYVIGRNNAVCDIVLSNPTVSRVHCVIQHKDDGFAYMYDLKTAYGTYVNRNKIEPQKYIRIKSGDTFKIANSTKMFIVNCHNEEEEESFSNVVSSAIISKQIHQLLRSKEDKILIDNVSNWGIKDNENEIYQYQHDTEQYEDENDLNINELNKRDNLTPKQKTLINKINQLLNERDHIIKEKDSIKHMDYEADEDALKKKIERKKYYFTKRLSEIKASLTTFKQSLSESLKVIEENQSRFNKKILKEINDEDEYYDMTKIQKKSPKTKSEIINYETLKATLERLIKDRQKYIDIQAKKSLVQTHKEIEIDSIDQYFIDNSNDLPNDINIKSTIESLNEEITKTQKLLDYVTPIHLKLKQQTHLQKPNIIPSTISLPTFNKPTNNRKKETINDILHKMNRIQHKATIIQQQSSTIENNSHDQINEDQDSLIQLDDETIQKLKQYKHSLYQHEDREREQKELLINHSTIKNESNLFKEIVANIGKDKFEMKNYPKIASRYDDDDDLKNKKQYKKTEYILPDEEEYLKEFQGHKRHREPTAFNNPNLSNMNDAINDEIKGNWIEENISENPFNKYFKNDYNN